jgi:hypothetical protein
MSVLAALAAPVDVAEAQPGWDSRPVAVGYDEGYRCGLRIGEDHGRRGQAFNFGVVIEYRQGDLGYRSAYGSRDRYRAEFRRGFEVGYRSGYDRYGRGRQGGPPPWSNGRGYGPGGRYGGTSARYDLAIQTGFDDGYRAGLDDGRDRRRFDPIAEGRYRSGDHGYERWYGPREGYKANYRSGFRQGYEQGYEDGRRYYGGRQRWWPF